MYCNDCGGKSGSWQEYCKRCGAELTRKSHRNASTEHSIFNRLFGQPRHY